MVVDGVEDDPSRLSKTWESKERFCNGTTSFLFHGQGASSG